MTTSLTREKLLILGVASALVIGVGVYSWRQSAKGKKKKSIPPEPRESVPSFVATSELNQMDTYQESKDQVESSEPAVEEILSDEKKEELAQSLKSKGNKFYSAKKYKKALELYSKALEYLSKENVKSAILYSNRAACYASLNLFDNAITDCTLSVTVDPTYAKAWSRRANAYEKLENYKEALNDYTMASILEEFKNSTTVEAADRCLRLLATAKTKEIMELRKTETLELPSLSFVTAYLGSFHYDYLPLEEIPKTEYETGDSLFVKAVDSFRRKKWDESYSLVTKALAHETHPISVHKAKALNMRGTFYFLMGISEESKKDYEQSLIENNQDVNTYIKLASILMEKEQNKEGLEQVHSLIQKAIDINPQDPDIYYHRGQIYFLTQDYQNALTQYEKCLELEPSNLFALIQCAVTQYRLGDLTKSNQLFKKAKKEHPKAADTYYYQGEVYLDMQKTDEALAEFDKAILKNPKLPLPHLNKAIISYHVKKDVEGAMEANGKAIEADSRCELAYLNLGQMYAQTGKLSEAMITFQRAIELSRSEQDVFAACIGMEMAKAQDVTFKILQKNRN